VGKFVNATSGISKSYRGRDTTSVRYLVPRPSYYSALRDRALHTPVSADRQALLEWFRSAHGFYRKRLRKVLGWESVPVLERMDIEYILPTRFRSSLIALPTSGTTGQIITVINDLEEYKFRQALAYRQFAFCDLPRNVRQLILADVDSRREFLRESTLGLGQYWFSQWVISASASPEEQLGALYRVRPHLLTGFASALVRLAIASPRTIPRQDLRVVSPGGEYLCAGWRSILRERYGCAVIDRYGCTECGAIGWECPLCGAYHANGDEMMIETGLKGVIITPLFLRVQPLLRYHLGDYVDWVQDGPTSCSIKLPVIRIREGRRDDWLYDGNDIPVSPLAFQFERYARLKQWKIAQRLDGNIVLFIAWEGRLSDGDRRALIREVRNVVAEREVEVIGDVAGWSAMGKFKRVLCKYVPKNRQPYT